MMKKIDWNCEEGVLKKMLKFMDHMDFKYMYIIKIQYFKFDFGNYIHIIEGNSI